MKLPNEAEPNEHTRNNSHTLTHTHANACYESESAAKGEAEE